MSRITISCARCPETLVIEVPVDHSQTAKTLDGWAFVRPHWFCTWCVAKGKHERTTDTEGAGALPERPPE